jgi:quinol---cytochrome c reductase iron-sulfur subunit, bacillus type
MLADPPGTSSSPRTPRRGFLGWAVAAAGAFVAAVAGAPVTAALLSPLRRRADAPEFVRVARLDALPEGRAVRATVVAARRDAWAQEPPMALGTVWLVRRGDTVAAYSAVCPHLGCGVEARGNGFACPCHGSSFDGQGRVVGGPAPRSLDPLEVGVAQSEDRAVEVRYRRFVVGISERREA